MSIETAKMSLDGEVTIPASLIKKLKLSDKNLLVFRESNGEIIIRPVVPFFELRGVDKKLGITSLSLKRLREEWNRGSVRKNGETDELYI